MAEAQQRQKKAADKNQRHVTFSVCDMVMFVLIRLSSDPCSRKLMPKWVGPFRMSKLVSNVNVWLELPTYVG
jgi:hypothetical protein